MFCKAFLCITLVVSYPVLFTSLQISNKYHISMVSSDVLSQPSIPSTAASLLPNSNPNLSTNTNTNSVNSNSKILQFDTARFDISCSQFNAEVTEIMKKNKWKVLPDIWDTLARTIPNQTMLIDEIHPDINGNPVSLSYSQVNQKIIQGATALQQIGVFPGDCVAMFAENSHRWFLFDQIILKAAACNAVRGSSTSTDELHYIYKNSRSVGMILENCDVLANIFQNFSVRGRMISPYSSQGSSNSNNADQTSGSYPLPKFVVVLYSKGMTGKEMYEKYINHYNKKGAYSSSSSGGSSDGGGGSGSADPPLKYIKEDDIKFYSYEEFEALSRRSRPSDFRPVVRDASSTATYVYTSGATSTRPKGVILSHRNIMYQVLENSLQQQQSPSLDESAASATSASHNTATAAATTATVMNSRITMLTTNATATAKGLFPLSSSSTTSGATAVVATAAAAMTSLAGSMVAVFSKLKPFLDRNVILHSTSSSSTDPCVGDVYVSVLPSWHIFERSCEYFALARGATLVYSDLKNFRKDIMQRRPHILVTVPRLLESMQKEITANLNHQNGFNKQLIEAATAVTDAYHHCRKVHKNRYLADHKPFALRRVIFGILSYLLYPVYRLFDSCVWSRIRGGLGGRLKAVVCGGASLPVATDLFFERVGIPVINGYGLTETSPVIANRKADYNVMGSVGVPVKNTLIKIVNPVTRQRVPAGQSGVLMVKGPGVMTSYMTTVSSGTSGHDSSRDKKSFRSSMEPSLSSSFSSLSSLIDSEGFWSTGDLARVDTATGCLVITGRYKDTIVLSNGENVCPEPLEERLAASCPLIEQVMLVGQDQRHLAALVVVNTKQWAIYSGGSDSSTAADTTALGYTEPECLLPTVDGGIVRPVMPGQIITPLTQTQTTQLTQRQSQPLRICGKTLNEDKLLRRLIREAIDRAMAQQTPLSVEDQLAATVTALTGGSGGSESRPMSAAAAAERVVTFTLLAEPFTVENGLMTQTHKLRRREVEERYAREILTMYSHKGKSVATSSSDSSNNNNNNNNRQTPTASAPPAAFDK